MSVDPLVTATNDPYGYAGQDPTNASDPLGLDKVYILSLNGRAYYVGRTSDLPKRLTAHEKTDLFCNERDEYTELSTGDLSTEAAAGLEQRTIETLGIDNLKNGRNEIAQLSRSRRWTYKSATDEGTNALQDSPEAVSEIDGFADTLGRPYIDVPPTGFWGELESSLEYGWLHGDDGGDGDG